MSCGDAYSPRWDNCVGLERFENGNIYRGEFHHGLREGLGFLIVNATGESDHNNIRFNNGPIRSNDGSPIYAGEFRGGLLNGHGVWFTKSGAGYSGTFIDNIAQSDVSHTNCSGALSPSWSNCVARISYEDGNVYYGEYMHGRREGIGMLEIHETGTSDETSIRTPVAGFYVGEFSGDRLNGQGMIFMPAAGFYGNAGTGSLSTSWQVIATPNARPEFSYEHADATPGTYEIVLQMWKYIDYRKNPDGEFVNSRFIDVSNKVTYTI